MAPSPAPSQIQLPPNALVGFEPRFVRHEETSLYVRREHGELAVFEVDGTLLAHTKTKGGLLRAMRGNKVTVLVDKQGVEMAGFKSKKGEDYAIYSPTFEWTWQNSPMRLNLRNGECIVVTEDEQRMSFHR